MNLTNEMYAAYDSAGENVDRDDRVIHIKTELGISLSKAYGIVSTIDKERGTAATRSNGVTDRIMDYLREAPRTEAEFKEWLDENGTNNTRNNFGVWNKIRQCTFDIHENMAKAVAEAKAEAKPTRSRKPKADQAA